MFQHANVRLTALKVMYNVMEVNHLNYFFKENISNIMNYVESRLIDVQYKVRIEAINVCARALTMQIILQVLLLNSFIN